MIYNNINGGLILKKNIFKKIILIITIILLLGVIAFTAFMVVNKYSFNDLSIILSRQKITDVGIYKIIDLNSDNTKVCTTKQNIYVISPYKTLIYDNRGQLINELLQDFKNPYITSNDEYAIVYSDDKAYYEIYKNGNKEKSVDESNILAISLGNYNYISIIKSGRDGYVGQVNTIDIDKNTQGSIKYADLYPISSTTLNDSDYYVIVKIDSLDIHNTYIDVYNLYEAQPTSGIKVEGSYLQVKALGKENFILVGDKGYKIYNYKSELIREFKGNIIQVVNNKNKAYISYTLNGKNFVQGVNEKGNEIFNKVIDYAIVGVNTYKNNFIVFGSSVIDIYEGEGKKNSQLNMFSTIHNVILIENNSIVIMENNNMVLYKYK